LRQKHYAQARVQSSAGLSILQTQANPMAEWLENARADLKSENAALGTNQGTAAQLSTLAHTENTAGSNN
jgi:hypothetical protein